MNLYFDNSQTSSGSSQAWSNNCLTTVSLLSDNGLTTIPSKTSISKLKFLYLLLTNQLSIKYKAICLKDTPKDSM